MALEQMISLIRHTEIVFQLPFCYQMQKLRDFGRAFTIELIILKRELGYVIKHRKVRGSRQ